MCGPFYGGADQFWIERTMREAYGGTSAILPILAESELRPGQYQLMSGSAFAVTSSGAATLPGRELHPQPHRQYRRLMRGGRPDQLGQHLRELDRAARVAVRQPGRRPARRMPPAGLGSP